MTGVDSIVLLCSLPYELVHPLLLSGDMMTDAEDDGKRSTAVDLDWAAESSVFSAILGESMERRSLEPYYCRVDLES